MLFPWYIGTFLFLLFSRTLCLKLFLLQAILLTISFSLFLHSSYTHTCTCTCDMKADSAPNDIYRTATSITPKPPRCSIEPRKNHSNFELSTSDWTYIGYNISRQQKKRNPFCYKCKPHEYEIVHNPTDVCKIYPGQREILEAVFIVPSSPTEISRRKKLRRYFSNITLANHSEMFRYAFVIETSLNNATRTFIELEREQYGDIIQVGMIRGYIQLTGKVIGGFNWTNNHCSRARYIVKMDEDSYVDITALSAVISVIPPNVGLFGQCGEGNDNKTAEVNNHMLLVLKLPATAAPYCYGSGYVITQKASAEVVRMSRGITPIYLDDLYVGMCLSEARLNERGDFHVLNVTNFMTSSQASKHTCPSCREFHSTVIWHKIPLSHWDCALKDCYQKVCASPTWSNI